jgi:hypothetical protein
MERNFTNENFEHFLRQNADSLKMRPRAAVWKGITAYLNRRKRRIGFVLGSLLLITSAIGYQLLSISDKNLQTAHIPLNKKASNNSVVNETINTTQSGTSVAPVISIDSYKQMIKRSANHKVRNPLLSFGNPVASIAYNDNRENEFQSIPFGSTDISSLLTRQAVNAKPIDLPVVEPLNTENILNAYKINSKKRKTSFQIYFTPTISYRKLSENKAYIPTGGMNISSYSPLYNINSAVTHKPDFGFEIGFASKYQLSNVVKIKAGLQFNVNRYDIKAFNAPDQLATIRLNNRYVSDSLNAITPYSNLNGYHTDWLQNFYFQVSAPVGIELKLRGDDKMQFGIATTIQPTYLLGDRVYLISTDYKNYAEVPWLVRRWNVNTSLETFVSYSTGHLKWQVGPQFRYQILSSFISKYPVKENLYDFGLKVGISLNK